MPRPPGVEVEVGVDLGTRIETGVEAVTGPGEEKHEGTGAGVAAPQPDSPHADLFLVGITHAQHHPAVPDTGSRKHVLGAGTPTDAGSHARHEITG